MLWFKNIQHVATGLTRERTEWIKCLIVQGIIIKWEHTHRLYYEIHQQWFNLIQIMHNFHLNLRMLYDYYSYSDRQQYRQRGERAVALLSESIENLNEYIATDCLMSQVFWLQSQYIDNEQIFSTASISPYKCFHLLWISYFSCGCWLKYGCNITACGKMISTQPQCASRHKTRSCRQYNIIHRNFVSF